MKGKRKQLLGFLGLVLVFAMTAAAYNLPVSEAAAQGNEVKLGVTVTSQIARASIISPKNNEVIVFPTGSNRTTTVTISQDKIKSLSTTLTCKRGDLQVYSETKTRNEADLQAAGSIVNETFAFSDSLDLDGLSCVATMAARDYDNAPHNESVAFTFRAMSLPNSGSEEEPVKPPVNPGEPCEGPTCGKVDEDNNPMVDVIINENVEMVRVQVYNSDNEPVFVDASGVEEPLLVNRSAFKDGKLTITLPMDKYNAKPGKYHAVFTASDGSGEVISVNEYWFEYMPKVETPGTGSIFKDMNLSRADYLLVGLGAFGAVAGFALYLIFRKSRR